MPRAPSNADPLQGPRAALARQIPRRPRVASGMVVAFAIGFAILVTPIITADRWVGALGAGTVVAGKAASLTVRVPPFAGFDTGTAGHGDELVGGWTKVTAIAYGGGGGVVIARGDVASRDDEINAQQIAEAMPRGPMPYLAFFLLAAVFAGLFSHHTRRSTRGKLVRVQLVNLALIGIAAVVVKIAMLMSAINVLVVPVAVFALLPTLVLDRVVGLATGTLAALVTALLVPFDVGVAILLLVQVATAGLVVAEHPKDRLRATIVAGAAATLLTALTYPLLRYLTTGHLPLDELQAPMRSAWVAAALGPAIATAIAVPLMPLYQLLVGEITHGKLIELEDLSHPLLRQIAERSPGTWQHSLMMANMAEIAANAIGANGRLVRVGAYYHDLGKSLQPKYFIENLEPGETSPHDKLPPETSCDAIFAHVTEGIVTARKAGLHERIVDFMHMHHGNGVLEYFWAKARDGGNPNALTVEHFRYPGVPPQSRETAILAICDAVEAASRTIKKAEPTAIDNLVQRIVYGKLHLGQLDDSGLSMSDLRKVADSLRETIRHANHGRIEYPWQKAEQSASASVVSEPLTSTGPRLDSLDRPAKAETVRPATKQSGEDPYAETDAAGATPKLRTGKPRDSSELAMSATAPVKRPAATETEHAVREVNERLLRDSQQRGQKISGTSDELHGGEFERRAALVERYGNNPPASRDSSDSTLQVELAEPEPSERSAMAARYANEPPASRDSGNRTMPVDRAQLEARVEPPRESSPFTSRDGSPHLEHSKPSDGDTAEDSSRRSPKRTDDTGHRRRATGDFVAQMVLEPVAKKDEPPREQAAPRNFATDIDTGKHRAAIQHKDSSKEIAQFTADATKALDAAAKDMDVIPPPITIPPLVAKVAAPDLSAPETPSAVRKRAATLPPTPALLRPPTVPAPNRRAPTVPPNDAADSKDRTPKGTLFGSGGELRKPAATVVDDESARTNPTMPKVTDYDASDSNAPQPDDTLPALQLPLPAPGMSDPGIRIEPPKPDKKPEWVRSLAARVDARLDDEFGTDTPVSAPTRAELQALLDTPPDATRKQSLEEIERLHAESKSRRSDQELDFTRRAPYPTAEVLEEDIEAAIEIVPAARTRTGSIGVVKKKPGE